MKYTIEGFSQEKAIEYGLDVEDLLILRWFTDFSPRMTQKNIDNEIYYWVNYKSILEDMPIFNFTSKDRLYRKMKEMTNKNILKHKNIKNSDGSFSYYTFDSNFENLISNR